MKTILVRQAVATDLDTLAAVFDQYRQFYGQASDVAAARAFLARRFDHGESAVFLAWDGRETVGFAQLYPTYSSVSLARVFVLNDLFVTPAARGRGVASQLLAAAQAHAWRFGAARVSLNVLRGNVAAQKLYTARGWQQDAQFLMFHRYPSTD